MIRAITGQNIWAKFCHPQVTISPYVFGQNQDNAINFEVYIIF